MDKNSVAIDHEFILTIFAKKEIQFYLFRNMNRTFIHQSLNFFWVKVGLFSLLINNDKELYII